MILFFKTPEDTILALSSAQILNENDIEKLIWLFGEAEKLSNEVLAGWFVGPRKPYLQSIKSLSQFLKLQTLLPITSRKDWH